MPIRITPQRRERISKVLGALEDIASRRQPRDEFWQKLLVHYEGKTQQKSFPWPGCASFAIPFGAIVADAVSARIENAVLANERLIGAYELTDEPIELTDPMTGQPLVDPVTGNPMTWKAAAELIEEYMMSEAEPALGGAVDFRGFIVDLVSMVTKLGTAIPKVIWDYQSGMEYDEAGNRTETVLYDNVRFMLPALSDLYVPQFYDSFDRIPLVTHKYLLRTSELKAKAIADGFDKAAIDEYLEQRRSTNDPAGPLQEAMDEIEGVSDSQPFEAFSEVWMAESWVRMDLDNTGYESRFLVDHAWDDPTAVFRIIPWPFENGKLPFCGPAYYIKRLHRFYGMGAIERVLPIERALTTNVQQATDNATVANTRMWIVNSASRGAQMALRTIGPNRIIPVEDRNDVQPLQMGEVYPSIFQIGNILREYGERLGKVSDYTLGRESSALGSQGTATATMALLQEAGQYFDTITRSVRMVADECLNRWFDYLCQYRPIERIRRFLGPRAEVLLTILAMPRSVLNKRIAVRVAMSASATTREIQKQEESAKFQILNTYYRAMVEAAQLRLQMPMLAPLIDECIIDADRHLRRLLESYGENYNTLSLPSWERTIMQPAAQMQMQAQLMGGMMPGGMVPGGNPMEGQIPDGDNYADQGVPEEPGMA